MNAESISRLVERLERAYGPPPPRPRFEPMDELVSCILSQHTADANSLPAFFRLKAAFPDWTSLAAAREAEIVAVIRQAGLANQKAKTIRAVLSEVEKRTGGFSIDHLGELPMLEARAWLESLPGVGPKTASIVLCFSFGMEAIPVDTHVFRVSRRLGLLPETMNANRAHDQLLKVVPSGWAYRYHMALIQLGRDACRAPAPQCDRCPVSSDCPSFSTANPKAARRKTAAAPLGAN